MTTHLHIENPLKLEGKTTHFTKAVIEAAVCDLFFSGTCVARRLMEPKLAAISSAKFQSSKRSEIYAICVF